MNVLDRYGIREVADITIYELDENGDLGKPVLFLDTLKITEIDVQKEQVNYYGGTSNDLILNWSYINSVTISAKDALFSMKSLATLCGGKVDEKEMRIIKTEKFKALGEQIPQKETEKEEWISISGWNNKFYAKDGKSYNKLDPVFFDVNGKEILQFEIGETYFCTYYLNARGLSIDINSDSFPGYYCVIGETFIRSEITNKDEGFFYFIIPKAKLSSKIVLEMSEENPSVFDFNFEAVKHKNLDLIELKQIIYSDSSYDLAKLDKGILNQLILDKSKTNDTLEFLLM